MTSTLTAAPRAAEPVVCHRCGVALHSWAARPPTCKRCWLAQRLEQVLDDGTGQINQALQPLAAALLETPHQDSVRMWLYRPYVVELLAALATGRAPLTHDTLTGWPRQIAARHLRHRLTACGVLPPVDRHLIDTEVWLHHRLGQLGEHPHERLLRQFALWHQLPRLRATAATRPLRPTAKFYTTQQFTQAQKFLTWLHDNNIDPAAVTQADIDNWYTSHRVHQRQGVRGFQTWAIEQGHLPRHLVVRQVVFKPGKTITQQRRLALLRRYVTDPTTPNGTGDNPTDTVPLPIRVAVCLLLLYAQPLSRIHCLTTADITESDTGSGRELFIRLGDPPTPVPEPFADLLRRLAAQAHDNEHGWLFPGRFAGQPITYRTLSDRLRQLGFPLIDARVSALRQLVLQVPAPVVADALGFHQKSTARQVAHAGATWSRYAAGSRNT